MEISEIHNAFYFNRDMMRGYRGDKADNLIVAIFEFIDSEVIEENTALIYNRIL